MIIKNTTDKKTPKVIGFGRYWIMPGEEKFVPDELLYVQERDKFDRPTGRKALLPAVATQQKLGMLEIVKPAPAQETVAPAVDSTDGLTAGEDEKSKEPEMTEDEKKKAEAAAKRKAAREAKKAAEAAAKAASEDKTE